MMEKYPCTKCSKSYTSQVYIDSHSRNVHDRERNLTCNICGHSYILKSQLERHKVTHTGETPFTCHRCNKSFGTRSSRTDHIRRVHQFM